MADALHDENGRPTIICASKNDGTTIVPVKGNPTNHGITADDNITGSDNGNNAGNAMIDSNGVSVFTALSSVDGKTIVEVYADPSTGRLLINSK